MMTPQEMLAELLERLSEQIKAKGREDRYCSITVQPGNQVVFDFGDEDCMGMAWVRLIGANPTVAFPNPDTSLNNCAHTLAFTVEVGMIGPAPQIDTTLNEFILPTDVELFDASMRQLEEMQMMYDAIRSADIPEKIVGDYTPTGPEGGVMGGAWALTIGGDD